MPPLLFALPTTSLLTFSNLLHDPSSSYTTALAEATSARTKLQLALKGVAENQAGSSALAVVDVSRGIGYSLMRNRLYKAICHIYEAS